VALRKLSAAAASMAYWLAWSLKDLVREGCVNSVQVQNAESKKERLRKM
jgi:hypothetical protein